MKAIFGIPEIVIMVFQSCDSLQDVMALASTCRVVASIWRLHSSSIIWPLAKAEIPGFSQALMAVSLSKRETVPCAFGADMGKSGQSDGPCLRRIRGQRAPS